MLVSHGFRPITEITSLLRCVHGFNPSKGGWICKTDFATGATSVEMVSTAREVTGVAGARPGFLRGALAGLAAAQSIGISSGNLNMRRKRICQELKRAQAFAEKFNADQKQLLFNQPRLPIRPVSLSQVQESLSAD